VGKSSGLLRGDREIEDGDRGMACSVRCDLSAFDVFTLFVYLIDEGDF